MKGGERGKGKEKGKGKPQVYEPISNVSIGWAQSISISEL